MWGWLTSVFCWLAGKFWCWLFFSVYFAIDLFFFWFLWLHLIPLFTLHLGWFLFFSLLDFSLLLFLGRWEGYLQVQVVFLTDAHCRIILEDHVNLGYFSLTELGPYTFYQFRWSFYLKRISAFYVILLLFFLDIFESLSIYYAFFKLLSYCIRQQHLLGSVFHLGFFTRFLLSYFWVVDLVSSAPLVVFVLYLANLFYSWLSLRD